jgi:hypothetical protein
MQSLDRKLPSIYASVNPPSIFPSSLAPVAPLLYASSMAAPTIYEPSGKKAEHALPASTNIYSSTPGNISNSNLYSSAVGSPATKPSISNPIYSSLPSLPTAGAAKEKQKPVVSEGNSTVGLMIWPQGPKKELIITGLKEGTSAFSSGLEVGDIIASVDDESVDDLKAEDVALKMAGPTGSKTKITTKGGREAILTRDVSADEANKTTIEVSHQAPVEKRFLSPFECQRYGVPLGALWSSKAAEVVEAVAAPKIDVVPLKPHAPAAAAPAAKSLETPAPRFLTPQECKMYNVPMGSRFIPKRDTQAEQAGRNNAEAEPVIRQEVEVSPFI